MHSPIQGQTIRNNISISQEPIDLSDAEYQRKILTAIIGDLQRSENQERTEIVYDPVLGVSKIFKTPQKLTQVAQQNKQEQSTWKKFTKLITCGWVQSQYKSSFEMITVLFDALKDEQSHWLERHYNRYSQQQLQQLKEQHINKMINVIGQLMHQIENDKVNYQTKTNALAYTFQLQNIYRTIKPKKHTIFSFLLRKENHYIFMLMISAFEVFSKSYTTYHRQKLKHLFKYIESQTNSIHNSIEVLRFLQNKDSIIQALPPVTQPALDQNVEAFLTEFLKKSRFEKINTKIGLVKVSQSSKRRRVINLLISGFLSQDKDKKQQWNQLLACMPDSEVYGLQWQSNTITRLIKFLVFSIKDILMGKDLSELLTKDNPFIPAFQVSIQAGEMLAYVIHNLFPFQFVNIVGYSLGSELIRAFIDKTIELNGGRNLNKVITMGGVSDIVQFKSTLQKTHHTINILNVRSRRDNILKYVLKRAKPSVSPIGLFDIQSNIGNHLIKNIDVSKQISGHFAFMTNFGTIAELLKLNQQ